MTAPFYRFGMFNDEISLIIAFLIGIGFGFFLERAGFGSARKLTAQFYFRDLTVLKVMFTAIITAMTGLYLCARSGLVDLSLVHLTPTLLVPQIVGGLLLGVGFVIGGYCPGTSVVSAATGRLDAVIFLCGMFAGTLVLGSIYPTIAGWTTLTSYGPLTLPAVFKVPYGLVVLAVVTAAIGSFAAAEWAERKFGGKEPSASSLTHSPRLLNPARGLAAALIGAGLIAAVSGDPYRPGSAMPGQEQLAQFGPSGFTYIRPVELSTWMVEGRADYTLIDVRSDTDFARDHIPGAKNAPLGLLTAAVAPRNEKVVLYAQEDTQAGQAWIRLKALGFKAVYVLGGGLRAWSTEVLSPAPPTGDDPVAKAEFAKRLAVAKYLGDGSRGTVSDKEPAAPRVSPTPPATNATAPATKSAKKKREGC